LRPGTLPVALIGGLGKASELAERDHEARGSECAVRRKELLDALSPLEPKFNGDQGACMPHVVNMSFAGVDSEALIVAVRPYIAISNGSACTSYEYKSSHVLQAMGLSDERIRGAIRVSWSHMTEAVDWASVADAIARLR
jgi:cysteine desulfurase